jgi:hypothetical protein
MVSTHRARKGAQSRQPRPKPINRGGRLNLAAATPVCEFEAVVRELGFKVGNSRGSPGRSGARGVEVLSEDGGDVG